MEQQDVFYNKSEYIETVRVAGHLNEIGTNRNPVMVIT